MLFLLVFCPPLDRAPVDNEHPIFDQGPSDGMHLL